MKRIRNILVYATGRDGGTAAVKQAVILARTNDAKVKLVDVAPGTYSVLAPNDEGAKALRRDMIRAQEARLEAFKEEYSEVKISVQVLEGNPAEAIIAKVISADHDLLIKSAEHPEGIAQRIFGTTGQRLFRKCPCPVWVIKHQPESALGKILVAVDPRPLKEDRHPMNLRILEMATDLADRTGAELHIVYAWPKWPKGISTTLFGESPSVSQERETADLQAQCLEVLIGRFRDGGRSTTVHLPTGDPIAEIVQLSRSLEVDLLVMGTINHDASPLFTIGNTAEGVLDQVDCSVLAIKPQDFASRVFTAPIKQRLGQGLAY